MKSLQRTALLAAGFCLFALASANAAEPAKILFFTKSARYEHSVIKQTAGAPSFAEKVLDEMSAKGNFKITTTKDGTFLTPENIAKFDAIMFYTSGDLTKPAKDGSPPMTEANKSALLDAVKNGKPFIAVHNALATFDKGATIDPYIEMMGGESIGHGAQQSGKNVCVDTKFPGCENLKDGLEFTEEWYSIKNFQKDLHVILFQDPTGMKEGLYQRAPYPATWARMHGKGRVFATSLGHREDVWTRPDFQAILNGGIQWALGRVEADITPNIETVTPNYAQLPPEKAKVIFNAESFAVIEELTLQGIQNGLGLCVDNPNNWCQVSLWVLDERIDLGADDRNIVCDRIAEGLSKALDGSIKTSKSATRDGHDMYWCLSLFELHSSGYLYVTENAFHLRFYSAENSAAYPDIVLTPEFAKHWQSRLTEFKRPK